MNLTMAPPANLGFVGAGRMAQAIAGGVMKAFSDRPPTIFFSAPSDAAAQVFSTEVPDAVRCSSNEEVCNSADMIILAVKPQGLKNVSTALAEANQKKLIISIAAGIPIAPLQSWLQNDRIIRVMPNTPCLVSEGVSGFTMGPGTSTLDRNLCEALFSSLGVCVEVTEPQLDAITGLSGSGPAYVFAMIESLSDGGVLVGLPREVATKVAIQTLIGSAKLALHTDHHPAILREQVTSPGGTTARGLKELEDHSFRAAIISAVRASSERAAELGTQIV